MKTQTLLPDLLNLSLIEIATQCFTALLAQGDFAYIVDDDGNVQCRYNTPDGRHCIAGLTLPDDAKFIEGDCAGDIVFKNHWRKDTPHNIQSEQLLNCLQSIHDTAARQHDEEQMPLNRAHMLTLLRKAAASERQIACNRDYTLCFDAIDQALGALA